jgi:hypothetical protein
MTADNAIVSIETDSHLIEISEGWLTIGTKQFPDDCVSLAPQEAEEVLKALLQWKYGSDPLVENKECPNKTRD